MIVLLLQSPYPSESQSFSSYFEKHPSPELKKTQTHNRATWHNDCKFHKIFIFDRNSLCNILLEYP